MAQWPFSIDVAFVSFFEGNFGDIILKPVHQMRAVEDHAVVRLWAIYECPDAVGWLLADEISIIVGVSNAMCSVPRFVTGLNCPPNRNS